MNVNSYYEILMVTRDAPPEVIRAAYKALSQKWHPDKNDHESAPGIMAMINTAYAELSDPDKRRAYHQWLEAEELRWTYQHPRPQPDCRPPEQEPKRGAFVVDEDLLRRGLDPNHDFHIPSRFGLRAALREAFWRRAF